MLADLVKLAYKLDKKGEYELSNDVSEVIKELAQRVGVNPEEIVALADYFDSEGESTLADKFDSLLGTTEKK